MLAATRPPALFDVGFRAFFLCAGVYGVAVAGIWALSYFGVVTFSFGDVSPLKWHAHEMVYGYSLAVIAGFLLTATANWTGRNTLHGWPLAGLVAIWILARLLFLAGQPVPSGIVDLLFIGLLSVAVTVPIVRARQRRQSGIIAKLWLFAPGTAIFTLGAAGLLHAGTHLGVYFGLYLVIGLILMMGRRVVPAFIKSGVRENVDPGNPRWLDILGLALYLVFLAGALVSGADGVAAGAALGLFVVNTWRLAAWHTTGIWSRPLVWVIYLALWFITLGFLLYFLAWKGVVPIFFAIHAFAYGGIGMMTLGMMARVSLGHTGRSIHSPPAAIQAAFGILALGALTRVVLPLLVTSVDYRLWVGLSMGLWIAAFSIFVVVYYPMLVKPRVDGRAL